MRFSFGVIIVPLIPVTSCDCNVSGNGRTTQPTKDLRTKTASMPTKDFLIKNVSKPEKFIVTSSQSQRSAVKEKRSKSFTMVDAVVSFVVERLGDFLIQEAVFLRGVRNEVKWLQSELGLLKRYIVHAEEKQVDNPVVRKWLIDITEIAYDTEDVFDKFILQVHDDDEDGGTKETKTRSWLPSMSCCFKGKETVNMYNIGKEIEELKNRINDLSRKRELYGLESLIDKGDGKSNSSNSFVRLRQLRRTTSFSIEEKIVGFEDDATSLLAKVFDPDPHRVIVSIYGMGGLGKTTLARKLYHNRDVKMKFNCRAWISVSQDYNIRDLLERIIKSFRITTMSMEDLKQGSEEDLERCLYEYLQRRSYLVVIDDVWQKEVWGCLKRAFPDNKNGSRVILTTRMKEIAERSDGRTHVHKLRNLRLDESWQLFCEKAFGSSNANDVDPKLKSLGMDMVQKCGGLPLAIVVLGGLLSTKSKPKEWMAAHEHIWQNVRNDSIHVSHLLALSFNDLPYQLKLCFLYLSLFPEDYEIDVHTITRLWVAEGLISPHENRMLEDTAEDIFNDLFNRSLIYSRKMVWGRVATCQVHDLLRDLAIQKAKELNFLHICDEIKHSGDDSSAISSCRRQAVYSVAENSLWLQKSNPSLRSLLFFDPYGRSCEMMVQLKHICTKFRCLRVLNFKGHSPDNQTLGEKIGKLIHLRYLVLGGTNITKLPPSILNLQRLQTLELYSQETEVELPNEIFKLQDLRHLYGRYTGNLHIDSLTKLQSLKYVDNESWSKVSTEKLVNLRELWIYAKLPTNLEFHFDSIAKLMRLQQLAVKLHYADSFGSLQPLSHCLHLTDLRLYGKIEKLPEDMHEILPNLECLLLDDSCLQDDPMPVLEKLPCLMMLSFGFNFYRGKRLICRAQGFPWLEVLRLDESGELEEWQIEEGAMPRLRGLSIPDDSMFSIPERFRSIPPPADWELEGSWLDML